MVVVSNTIAEMHTEWRGKEILESRWARDLESGILITAEFVYVTMIGVALWMLVIQYYSPMRR